MNPNDVAAALGGGPSAPQAAPAQGIPSPGNQGMMGAVQNQAMNQRLMDEQMIDALIQRAIQGDQEALLMLQQMGIDPAALLSPDIAGALGPAPLPHGVASGSNGMPMMQGGLPR